MLQKHGFDRAGSLVVFAPNPRSERPRQMSAMGTIGRLVEVEP